MPLKLVKRPKSPNWIMRGTVFGKSIEETTGTSDKKIAEAIRIKREKELLNEGVFGKSVTITFAQAAVDYIEHSNGETRFLKPLADHFGECLLKNIGQHEIEVASKKLYPTARNATRNRQVFTPMSAILKHAAFRGWCAPLKLKRPKQPEGKIVWMKPDEADRLIEACAPHLKPLAVFMLYTGARTGEALWLDWRNVDLDLKQVTFPKTKNGEARSVPLHPRVLQELSKINERHGDVFRTHKGQPYDRPDPDQDEDTSAGTRIKSAFKGACKRAGLGTTEIDKTGTKKFKSSFTPHACRHTWATWHYRQNRDLTSLQHLGGWKSIAMVMRYAHTNVEEHAASINSLPWGKSGEEAKKKEIVQ
jgi:integrase